MPRSLFLEDLEQIVYLIESIVEQGLAYETAIAILQRYADKKREARLSK